MPDTSTLGRPADWETWHIGRSFEGHDLEDGCPCPQEPCGLVRQDEADPSCLQHPDERCQTIRQMHSPDRCPARGSREALGRAEYDRVRTDAGAPHWHLLEEWERESWREQAETMPLDRSGR